MAKVKTFTDEIRDAIRNSGLTQYRICKEVGLATSGMTVFMSGKKGLSLKMLDKIAGLISMHVILTPKKGR